MRCRLFLALALPLISLADNSGSTTLKPVQALNLDTNAIANAGGDILWDGLTLSMQGKATGYNFGTSGAAGQTQYNNLNLQSLMAIPAAQYTKAQMRAQLVVGDVFAVHTSAGNYAKVLVTSTTQSVSGLTIQYTSYTAPIVTPPDPNTPKITNVENSASNIPAGLPNAAIAQGALFIVRGTLMGPTNVVVASSFPLSTSIAGTSIQVTVAGTTTNAIMYYSLDKQVAAILPSKTPTGTGTFTVTYNGLTSAPFPITVVASNIGLFTLDSSGSGDVVATLPADNTVVTTNNAPAPGEIVTFWATGLGPVNSDESNPAQQADMTSVPLKVFIGGQQANVLFRGRNACCSAVDTIYVTVPAGLSGCANSVVMQIGNLVSNAGSMPIGTNGRACVPVNPQQTTTSSGTGTHSFGGLALQRIVEITPPIGSVPGISIKQDLIGGAFEKVTYVSNSNPQGQQIDTLNYGSCTVKASQPQAGAPAPNPNTVQSLDAGQITVSGPGINGSRTLSKTTAGGFLIYGVQLDSTATTLQAGPYVFTGAGGPDVGSFTVTYNNPAELAWTNQTTLTTINRAAGATITWTGGDPSGYVTISGASTYRGATNVQNSTVTFTCLARVSDGSFFIPPIVLLALPPSTAVSGTNIIEPGSLSVISFSSTAATFQASGIEIGGIGSGTSLGNGVTYQ